MYSSSKFVGDKEGIAFTFSQQTCIMPRCFSSFALILLDKYQCKQKNIYS